MAKTAVTGGTGFLVPPVLCYSLDRAKYSRAHDYVIYEVRCRAVCVTTGSPSLGALVSYLTGGGYVLPNCS